MPDDDLYTGASQSQSDPAHLYTCTPQVAKSTICTFCTSHFKKSITWIRPQLLHHRIHRIVLCDSLIGQKRAISVKMQQTRHIIKCHCYLPKRKVETRSLLVLPLHKCTNKTVVNQAIAGILKPIKTRALNSVTPPPCSHDRDDVFIVTPRFPKTAI